MLTLILGRAASGKTGYALAKMAEEAKNGRRSVLIVPEQYSHEAERALAEAGGDGVSLRAEVLSFSRLCNRVFAETGGLAARTLDRGGSILAMSLALSSLAAELNVYNVGDRGPEFLGSLVDAYTELKASRIGFSDLHAAAEQAGGAFGRKLDDLALLFPAYEAVLKNSGCETEDRIGRLAEAIGDSTLCAEAHFYIDGFTDFTAQELRVAEELLRRGAEVTVLLNTPDVTGRESVFSLPAKTARRLLALAKEHGVETEILHPAPGVDKKCADLRRMEERLFDYSPEPAGDGSEHIAVYAAADIAEECALAAAETLRLVRSGYRFRDIIITAPAWDKYALTAAETFRKYGIPTDISEKRDVLDKPVMLFVLGAFDILINNWAYADVFRYLKTGLAGLEPEACDLLENYVLKWNIRGAKTWGQESAWEMSPGGYAAQMTDAERETLAQVDELRRRAAEPLLRFQAAMAKSGDVLSKVRALYAFMQDVALEEKLRGKAEKLAAAGDRKLAEEYGQLWDLLIRAMEQFADIMGRAAIGTEEFARLLKLVLSQYDIGTIPTSVDSVGVGSLERVRGRNVRHMILMGAADGALPSAARGTGIFSDDERDELKALGIAIAGAGDERMEREMGKLYAGFALPSDGLTVSWPKSGAGRRSYLITRLMKLFAIEEKPVGEDVYTAAPAPCFEYAAAGGSPQAKQAWAYFEGQDDWRGRVDAAKRAAALPAERLSRLTAERLYGKDIRSSASRVDRYYSCKFAYFLQYGLKAKPRRAAELDLLEIGSFMHYVLENVVRDTEAAGGFGTAEEDALKRVTTHYVREYAAVKLGGLEGKSGRFRYLFTRLGEDMAQIVLTMAEELKDSDFRPLDFELDFSDGGDVPAVTIEGPEGRTVVNGSIDRVDGWLHDGKLYVKVVDYKTGAKSFDLSDVWYGKGLQMLIYLLALQTCGEGRYGHPVAPAGFLYTRLSNEMAVMAHDVDDAKLAAKLVGKAKRSGMILDDAAVVEAMSRGKGDGYLPVKFTKDGTLTGNSLVTLEQLGALARHVEGLLARMGDEIRNGTVDADPAFHNEQDLACVHCDYFEVCHYGDDDGRKKRRLTRLKPPQVWEKMGGKA